MHRLLPPICLLLALAMLIAGFAILSVEPPEPSVDLHRALTSGDEKFAEALEARLLQRRWARKVLLGGLFCGSVVMTITAFATMRPSGPR